MRRTRRPKPGDRFFWTLVSTTVSDVVEFVLEEGIGYGPLVGRFGKAQSASTEAEYLVSYIDGENGANGTATIRWDSERRRFVSVDAE